MNNLTIMNLRLLKGISIALFGGLLTACAAVKMDQVIDKEQLLAAAGFKMQLANTPEEMTHLKNLTQQKLVTHIKDGTNYYVYADATNCKCMYIGQEAAYQSYKKLQAEENSIVDQEMTADVNENEEIEWGLGGSYGKGLNPR